MTDTLHAIALSLRDEIKARYPDQDVCVHEDLDVGEGYDGWCIQGEKLFDGGYVWYSVGVHSWSVIYHDSCTKRFEENICFDYEDPGLIDKLLTEIERSVKLWPI